MILERLTSIATVVGLVLVGAVAWNRTARAGYESAEYETIETDGKYEIREYPDLMIVATTTKIDAQGRDGSFMKLFRYISGANEAKQKISMTTPVFMENDRAESEVQMGFVMPSEVAAGSVPTPSGEDVVVRKRAGGRFAVLRFSGRLSAKLAKEQEAKLRAWMKSKGLEADVPNHASETATAVPQTAMSDSSGVEAASYDPPFTPAPLRRNEVLIRLK
ncbi:SOUL family heme-binding protein [Aureliella helgolandensis]|nr:heme-binding protein [Aureliella helgolandensis]